MQNYSIFLKKRMHIFFRYKSELKQLKGKIFEVNMENKIYKDDYTRMSERLKNLETERLTHIKFKEDSTQMFSDMKSKINIYEQMLQQYKDKIIEYEKIKGR